MPLEPCRVNRTLTFLSPEKSHRIDRTILIPNISVHYGLCALVYAVLGMISIVAAIRVSRGAAYPVYYVGLQAAWPLVLWLGMYSEIWATFASFYIRKHGAHYEESWPKTVVAVSLPFLFPIVACTPPFALFYLAAGGFNTAIRQYEIVDTLCRGFQANWVEADGLDIINLLSILQPTEKMALSIITYSERARPGWIYISAVLLITLVVYVIGAWLEISHLKQQAAKLRSQMKQRPKFPPMSPLAGKKVEQQLMEEWSSGIVRQASLLEWACLNRQWTAALISVLLTEAAATSLWYGLTPLSIKQDSAQFQTIILVSCYLNGVLSMFVSLLILFRSLDGSSVSAQRLQRAAPWLPLPPAVSPEAATQMTTGVFAATEQRDSPYESSAGSTLAMSPMMEAGGMGIRLEMDRKDEEW